MKKAVIFDRDGTLIVDKVYLNDPEQIKFLPETFEGLKILKDMGFVFFVATNQSGIPRGLVQIENLHEIHRRMNAELSEHGLKIEKFYYAPYMTDSNHPMRKPNPGMLLAAAEEYGIDLSQSWMLGDKDVDVLAGQAASCRTIVIKSDHTPTNVKPDFIAETMKEAAEFIAQHPSKGAY